ncbi:hypothetical protein [Microbacterium testaceum]|uniref:hypothetical protein n=1 Tax=Microbacterium testaceum TaxID=2033 RepID=UPI0038006D0B
MTAKTALATRRFHVLVTGTTVPLSSDTNAVLSRGQHFNLTPELYELTKDRNGESVYDLSATEQVDRWGAQRFAEGDAPDDIEVGDDSEGHQYALSQRELDAAYLVADKTERENRVREIRRKYKHVLNVGQVDVRPEVEGELR